MVIFLLGYPITKTCENIEEPHKIWKDSPGQINKLMARSTYNVVPEMSSKHFCRTCVARNSSDIHSSFPKVCWMLNGMGKYKCALILKTINHGKMLYDSLRKTHKFVCLCVPINHYPPEGSPYSLTFHCHVSEWWLLVWVKVTNRLPFTCHRVLGSTEILSKNSSSFSFFASVIYIWMGSE